MVWKYQKFPILQRADKLLINNCHSSQLSNNQIFHLTQKSETLSVSPWHFIPTWIMDKVCVRSLLKLWFFPFFQRKKIVFAGTADFAQFKIQRDIQMNSFLIKVSRIGICRCISEFDIELCKKISINIVSRSDYVMHFPIILLKLNIYKKRR